MPQFSDDLFLGPAITYMGTGQTQTEGVFTGSVTLTVMTITQAQTGDPLTLGQYVSGTGITAGSYITAFGTGNGGVGTYTLSASSSATGSITISSSGDGGLGDPSPMDLGVGPLGRVYIWDCIPLTLQAANIAASQTPSAAGALTLTAGTSAKSVTRSDGTVVVQLNTPRAVSITLVTGGTARAYTVAGYDYFGQPMTEVITTVAAATTPGKKAFYQIASVTGAGGGSTTALTVGTTDVFGLPVRCMDAGYVVKVGWNNTLLQNAGTFVAADMTSPATSSTGDVRGTFTPTSASDGTKRLVMTIALPAIAVGPNATRTGALGVTQA
jgi:hypothetical protein